MIDQNNNSSKMDILNIYKINQREHITDKKLIKFNSKELNTKNIILREESQKKSLNKKSLFSSSIKNNESFSFYENFQTGTSRNKYNKRKMKYLFPYYFFLLDFIFDKFLHPEKFFCVPKSYFIVYNYMCQIYDISSHILLFKQVNILKKMLGEKKYEDGGESINKFQKINIKQRESIEQLGKDLKQRRSVIFSNDLF